MHQLACVFQKIYSLNIELFSFWLFLLNYINFAGLIHDACLECLLCLYQARYVVDEVKDKNGEDMDVSSWQQEYVQDLPEQENGCVSF